MLSLTLARVLVALFTLLAGDGGGNAATNTSTKKAEPHTLKFELRHLHATSANNTAHVIFSDAPGRASSSLNPPTTTTYAVRTRPVRTYKPASLGAQGRVEWDEEESVGPDVESRETLLELAKMTNNAYVVPEDPAWYDIGEWNISYPFGWEPDEDGLRGHVFATADNGTVVIGIKGTSAGVFGGGGPTAKRDKLNDNMLFSCCCARVDWTWTTVCDCHRGGWRCDVGCVQEAMGEESLFYPIGINLYNNITFMYPDATIWIVGHSLGGALASLMGVTFGKPVVAFESPGERMAASRLHLPSPPSTHHVTHIYHTADPIAMGTCNGVFSSCALGGYAMESKCHLGKTIVYDTVSNASWSVDVRTHGIVTVIEKVLSEPWPPSVEVGREVPEAVSEDDCVVSDSVFSG